MQTHVENRLIEIITPLIASMGYEVVHVEVQTHRQKTLRLFIDFSEQAAEPRTVGIEDCIKVSLALDEPLDQDSEIEGIFHGAYELEVSSPGVDRPLRQKKDFKRFAGKLAKLHTFRALTEDEMGNPAYFAKNSRQKNFLGVIQGVGEGSSGDHVLLVIGEVAVEKKGQKSKAQKAADSEQKSAKEIRIPLSLISKANLEPVFEFEHD